MSTTLSSISRLASLVVGALFAAAAVPLALAAAPTALKARVYVAKDASDADVLRIRDNMASFGAVIHGYTAGDAFVVSASPQAMAAIATVHKVAKVDPLPLSQPSMAVRVGPTAAQIAALISPNCAPVPSPEQSLRASKLLKPAPAITPAPLSLRRARLLGSAAMPTRVDNSLAPFFPPIGEQEGRSSCVAWAAGYYWSTYTQAADEGIDVSGEWLPRDPPCEIVTYNPVTGRWEFDPVKFAACLATIKDPPRPSRATEYIGSPAFLYPLIHVIGYDSSGHPATDDGGAYLSEAMSRLNLWGVGSWKLKPYEPWHYDAVVYEWPTEEQWVEAMPRRTGQSYTLAINQQSDFDKLRQHLANGQLAVAGFQQYWNLITWGSDPDCEGQGTCPGMSQGVLTSNAGSTLLGGHAITIVGYDDEKPYVDPATGQPKRGALLMANSAGPLFGVPNTAGGPSKGFFWMSYDYARAHLYEVIYNSDRPHYRPRLYAAARLESAVRTSGRLYAGIGFPDWGDFQSITKFTTDNVLPDPSEIGRRPLESAKRLVVDMSDGLPYLDLNGPVPLLFLRFNPFEGGSVGMADFYFDRFGTGAFSRLSSPDPVKAIPPMTSGAYVCNNVLQNGDVNLDGGVDRRDLTLITSTLTIPPLCVSDPRDMDRDGRVTVVDVRKAALSCSRPGCAPK